MCGISAIYCFEKEKKNIQQYHEKLIKDMTSLLQHRGPDQGGTYSDERIFLGHRRLSILDTSKKGIQPMSTKDKGVIISYNGETYNFNELKKTLKDKYKFVSNSDTEVLLYAYKEWGIDFIKKLNGMFAFVLYDKKKDTLYAVRDRLGIKPLYYLKLKDKILISSEIKSLLTCSEYKKELNYKAVSSYLSYRYPLGNMTFFKNIHSLEPGCLLKINREKVEKQRYWNLEVKRKIKDKGEMFYLNKIRHLFENSVKRRMISDVPLGSFLSGGLDSSAVVAIMAQNSEHPVKTFTIGFQEQGYNEFSYAKQVAQMHQTDHKEILLSTQEYFAELKKLIKFKDAPLGIPNEVPLYLMSKELKKDITVVLSGEGADEIFSGYGRIFRSPFDYYRIKILENIPFAKKLPLTKKMYKNLRLRYNKLNFKNPLQHFLYQYNYFPFKEKWGLFSNDIIEEIDEDKWIFNLFKEHFNRFKISYYRRISYIFEKMHLPGLLQRVDICTMAASVESRVPFVDHELVEFMINVPIKYKMKWKSFDHLLKSLFMNSSQISENNDVTKYLLRKIIKKDLPQDILTRKKKGFPVPLNTWSKQDFVEFAKKELLAENAKTRTIFKQKKLKEWIETKDSDNFGQKLWMILNLEYFMQEYF